MKKIIVFIISFVILFCISCNESVHTATIKSIDISGKTTINIGEETLFLPIYDDSIESLNIEIVWESLDPTVATVFNGLVTGIKEGITTIKVIDKISKLEKEVTINVVNKVISKLNVECKNIITIDDSETIDVIYDNSCNVELSYRSSDESIATIDNGVIKAISVGVCTIYVKDMISNIEESITITVNPKEKTASELVDIVIELIGNEGFDSVILPQTLKDYPCEISYYSSDESLLDTSSGYLEYVDLDTKVALTVIVTYKGETKEKTFDYTIISSVSYDMKEKFMSQFRAGKIFDDIYVETTYSDFGGTKVEWVSNDLDIFTNSGKLVKPLYETPITITYTIETKDPYTLRSFTDTLLAQPMSMSNKEILVKDWIARNILRDGKIYKDTVLPNYIDDFDIYIEWFNEGGTPLKLDFSVENPILGEGLKTIIKIREGKGVKPSNSKFEITFRTNEVEITDMWEKIKLFTDTIASTNVTTYNYNVVSWTAQEFGYIPFYSNEDIKMIVDILPYKSGNCRTGIEKPSTEYITIHDTGSPSKGANALAHNKYIKSINDDPNQSSKSWHYTIDDEECYQHLPLDEVGWHAGDGSRRYGTIWENGTKTDCIGGGNYNSIGIESCIDEGSDYTQTMRNMAKLVSTLLIRYNLSFDRIKQHYNFSGKNCPQVMRNNNRWNEFIYLVKLEYYAKLELKGVIFQWFSENDYLNSNGQVTSKQPVGTPLSFKVKVTYDGESREFSYTSVINKR